MIDQLTSLQVPRIQQLDPNLVNQIAAGEVVERPAAVVKELVENSLDAHATRIDILLSQGGLEEIRIIDNGVGIHPDDLRLSLAAHATSKIKSPEDLEAIQTFGFRGEALASIAAVCEVELKSRTAGQTEGQCVSARYGEISAIQPVATAIGTSITVRNLFHELPARLKFMRSPSTELSHCSKVIRELALANPGVSFFLSHQGRQIQSYTSPDRAQRFRECFKINWNPIHLKDASEDLMLEGFLSPAHLVQDKGELFTFINGRTVRHRVLMAAIRNFYRDTLGPHHDPSGAVYLDVRHDWVDVNVHPQKWEVRLYQQDKVYQWIRAQLRKTLEPTPISVSTPGESLPSPSPPPPRVSEPMAIRYELPSKAITDVSVKPWQTPLFSEPVTKRFRYLSQLRATYLLCEDSTGLWIADQHALHEKMEFERLRKQYEGLALPTQTLLIPKVIHLAPHHVTLLESEQSQLSAMGIEYEIYGDGDVAIKTLPTHLEESKLEAMLKETCDWILESIAVSKDPFERTIRPVFATLACHSVVTANQALSSDQVQVLLKGLESIEEGWTCPHGRPILYPLSFAEIEKNFKRR